MISSFRTGDFQNTGQALSAHWYIHLVICINVSSDFFSTLVTSISSPAKNSLRLIPTMLWSRRRNQPVPEFFAVDKALRALLLCAVKGGASCHQTSYLQFSRFNLSLFLRLPFFITHLTLPFWIFIFSYTLYWQVQNRTSYFGFLQKLFFYGCFHNVSGIRSSLKKSIKKTVCSNGKYFH